MPICAKCTQPMKCACEVVPSLLGSTVKPCILEEGAIWVHVADDDGHNVKDAFALKDGADRQATKGNGLAIYDPLSAKTYEASLEALSTDLQKLYVLPPTPPQPAKVSPGQITYVGFTLQRKAQMQVQLTHKTHGNKFVDAQISITEGPDKPPTAKTDDSGLHEYTKGFGRFTPGPYKLKVELSTDDAKKYQTVQDFRSETHDVALDAGEIKPVAIEIESKNLVKPKVEVEYLVVLLDRKLSAHQASTETKILPPLTRVELSFTEMDAGKPDQPYAGSHQYDKGGNFTCGAGVEIFFDSDCLKPLPSDGALTAEQLPSGGTCELFLRGKTPGTFDAELKLKTGGDRFIELDLTPTKVAMGVVEIKFKLHQHDKTTIDGMADIDPDVEPYTNYYAALHGATIPDQKAMTDQQKVADGRVLHEQIDKNHGRARLLVEKLDSTQWPPGTDDYDLGLYSDGTIAGLQVFDKDFEGTEKELAKSIGKVSALKSAELVLWVEGKATSKALRDLVLDLGLTRADSAAAPHLTAHEVKRNGDWARFTVVKVEEVKIDTSGLTPDPLETSTHRYHINFRDDNGTHDGRKLKLTAKLTEPIAGVALHFMLAPDADNMKTANWGVDLPWPWKDVDAKLKHIDKPTGNRKKLLHLLKETDDQGKASQEVVLSRFGGDKFFPGVYLAQDPHLAKYMPADDELKKKKPVLAADPVIVWRKFWYQAIQIKDKVYPAFTGAEGQYAECRATMESVAKLEIEKVTIAGFTPTGIYKKYMFEALGGTDDVVVVSDNNKAQFFATFAAEADKPLKTPIAIADFYTDGDGTTAVRTVARTAIGGFPVEVTFNKFIISPPAQGGALVHSGTWTAFKLESDGTTYTNLGTGAVTDAAISIAVDRATTEIVKLACPTGLPPGTTHVAVSALSLQAAEDGLLGGFDRTDQRTVVRYDPTNTPLVQGDFQNTVAHEVGHSLFLATKKMDGITAPHPNWYWDAGNHCNHATDKCLMYESGPVVGSLNKYCPKCHPYVLAQNMFKLKAGGASAYNE